MSEQAVLWLFGILIGALFALVGLLWKIVWDKLSAIDSGALASFQAMDREREKQWMLWREVVDERLKAKRLKLEDHEHRVTRLERNGNGH